LGCEGPETTNVRKERKRTRREVKLCIVNDSDQRGERVRRRRAKRLLGWDPQRWFIRPTVWTREEVEMRKIEEKAMYRNVGSAPHFTCSQDSERKTKGCLFNLPRPLRPHRSALRSKAGTGEI
jgi:hypothetical protein